MILQHKNARLNSAKKSWVGTIYLYLRFLLFRSLQQVLCSKIQKKSKIDNCFSIKRLSLDNKTLLIRRVNILMIKNCKILEFVALTDFKLGQVALQTFVRVHFLLFQQKIISQDLLKFRQTFPRLLDVAIPISLCIYNMFPLTIYILQSLTAYKTWGFKDINLKSTGLHRAVDLNIGFCWERSRFRILDVYIVVF